MADTVTGAVAKRNEMSEFITTYRKVFEDTLPDHLTPDAFVRLAQGVLRRDPDLTHAARQNPDSLLQALLDCARLGHEPGTTAYALTWRKVKGTLTILGIEQYQGVIERMYRAGAIAAVKCEVVREHDQFAWSPTRMRVPEHEYDPLATAEQRGPLRGVYAYAEMQAGTTSRVVVMAADEVGRHRAVAATEKVWDAWPDPMWRKTAMHELEKWVPTSSEYLRQRAEAAATVAEATAAPQPTPATADPPADTSRTINGQVMPDPAPVDWPDWPETAQPGSAEAGDG